MHQQSANFIAIQPTSLAPINKIDSQKAITTLVLKFKFKTMLSSYAT